MRFLGVGADGRSLTIPPVDRFADRILAQLLSPGARLVQARRRHGCGASSPGLWDRASIRTSTLQPVRWREAVRRVWNAGSPYEDQQGEQLRALKNRRHVRKRCRKRCLDLVAEGSKTMCRMLSPNSYVVLVIRLTKNVEFFSDF